MYIMLNEYCLICSRLCSQESCQKLESSNLFFYFVWSVDISEKPKLEKIKVACDNLESPEVCSAGVLRRSSAMAVETGLF